MSLWISNHGKYDRRLNIICDRLVTANNYLRIAWTFQGIVELGLRLYDSQRIPRHDVIGLTLRTTGIEMHGENFKEGSILVYLVCISAAF